MRLLEFQAKRMLAEYGIPIPGSRLVRSSPEAEQIELPAVLKAQVPTGGRGKAGGIRAVAQSSEALEVVKELLGSEIRGYPVRAILAEDQTEIIHEFYLALLLDKRMNRPLAMASAAGGVDIEEVAATTPEQIVTRSFDFFLGLQPYTIRLLGKAVGVQDVTAFGGIMRGMYALLRERDATLVEINPLAETANGLVALDAKIVLDDKAAFRHGDLFAFLAEEQVASVKREKTPAEELAEERGITYVQLDGDIGMIADGAGTGMLTVDLIQDAGGQAANFCELGGLANPDVMCQAIETVLANDRVKALLISLIGGLTRMDEMAEGIVQYLNQNEARLPLVVRMYGTQEEVGKALLGELGIETYDNLPAAVRAVVTSARAS